MLVHCEAALHRRDSGDSDAVQRWSSTEGRRSVTRAQLTLHWCSPGPSGICHANGIRHAVAARIIVAMRHEPSATRSQRASQQGTEAGTASTAAGIASTHSSGHSGGGGLRRARAGNVACARRSGALLPRPAAIRVSSRSRGVEMSAGRPREMAARDGRASPPRTMAAHLAFTARRSHLRGTKQPSLKQLPACRR